MVTKDSDGRIPNRGGKGRPRFKGMVRGEGIIPRGGRKATSLTTTTKTMGSTFTGTARGGQVRGRRRGATTPGASLAASQTMPQPWNCNTEIVREGGIGRGSQWRKVGAKVEQSREVPSTE